MDDILKERINCFIESNQIPNILFHSEHTRNNISMIEYLIKGIYKNKERIKESTLYVNCAYGIGIKFIRDQIKFFAKTNITSQNTCDFKSVILLHAEFLTIDAQSALRRCIEEYSHNTRFFITVHNKDKLIKPILSRFCDIYVSNLSIKRDKRGKQSRLIKKYLLNIDNRENLFEIAEDLYNSGVYYKDFFGVFEKIIDNTGLCMSLIVYINKIRHYIKNDKLLLFNILNIYSMRNSIDLENIYPF